MADAAPNIPGAPYGFNGRLSVGGYGTYFCRIVEIGFGVKILSSEESAASRKAFYPLVTLGSSFTLYTIHNTTPERDNFNKWIRGYMEAVSSNKRISGTMRVEVPARRFVRVGVCSGTLQYGDAWNQTNSWTTSLDFVGASAPISAVGGAAVAGVTYYKNPTSSDPALKHFYPSQAQVSGAETLDGALFNRDAPEALVYLDNPAQDRAAFRALVNAGVVPHNVPNPFGGG